MPPQSKTAQSYGQEVQPGAWWAIQRTGGQEEERDEVIGQFIDSTPASELSVVRSETQSTELCKSLIHHWT